jgi:hypothetical protein
MMLAPERKIKETLSVIHRHHPVNMGGLRVGNMCKCSEEDIISRSADYVSTFNGVFDDPDVVKEVLRDIRRSQIGLSVVVSGLYEETEKIAQELGICPHTVNFSLGVWGKKELLPPEPILEVTTMCGHGLISRYLVEDAIDKVAKGAEPGKVAKDIGKICHCAIFNIARARQILIQEAAKR